MIWQRTAIFIAWAVATSLLFLSWKRHSLERGSPRRLAELYLWVFTLPLLVVGLVYASLGLTGFGVLAALHLIAVGFAVRLLSPAPGVPAGPARLTSGLLLIGPTLVLLGAITWPGGALSSIAERPESHVATAGLFLLGSFVTLAGFVGLRSMLLEAGEDWLPGLGLAGLQLGTALWAGHLLIRIAVVRPVAVAAEPPPSWFDPLVTLSGGLYAIYMALAYLATAAFAAALLRTGWVSGAAGRILVGFGLLAAVGFVAPGPFRPPLMVQLPVYATGILLLRKRIIDLHRSGDGPQSSR